MGPNCFTHLIAHPPVTDTEGLLGMYRGLFDALQIINHLNFPVCGGYQHAIPESNELIKRDFGETFLLLRNCLDGVPNSTLTLVNARVSQFNIVFTFKQEVKQI